MLYRAEASQIRAVSEARVEGEAGAVISLVDELSARLLASFGPSSQLASLAARTTDSPAALLAFLEGDRELREGRFNRAVEAFRRATDADTTFALAYYGLSRAANWIGQANTEGSAAMAALRHAGRLSDPDRWLVEAWGRYRVGHVAEADSLYRAVLRARPDDVEAWLQLGELGFHYGSMFGRPPAESRAAFERVLAYEPGDADAVIHLARLAAQAGEQQRLDSLVRQVLAREPEGSQALQLSVLRSVVRGEPELPPRLQPLLNDADGMVFRGTVMMVAAHGGDLGRAAMLARARAGRVHPPSDRIWSYTVAAQLELARGRWSAARVALDTIAQLIPEGDGEIRAGFLTFPLLELPAAELDAARAALVRSSRGALDLTFYSYPQRRFYLLGMLSLRLSDSAAVRHYLGELDRFSRAEDLRDTAFSRRFALDLRAHQATRQVRPAEALALLGQPETQPDHMRPTLTSYYKANERWLRAELLTQLGRDEEALRWYATFPDPDAYDLVYLAPSHLRRAEIHERRGEREQAAEHYRRFLDLWQDADPELQPPVRQARERLERLQAGR